ncbi:hypothetical protein ACIQAD_11710 [Streptomyces sp. NPDC088551]|uniref:hypothetical protein n=1 Tax=Streptomyces sp. NPDC088551 TaxID=3365863 RepID=UPI003828544C
MEPVCHVDVAAVRRLRELDLTPEDLQRALAGGLSEARLCTEMDAPGMAGYAFWSRSNRTFRERMTLKAWTYSNAQSILRTTHPTGTFAITAVSGSGMVGEEAASYSGDVRTKNPKGSAVAKLVERNFEQLPLPIFDNTNIEDGAEANDIPTWFLLYKSSKEGLRFELSLPVQMHGKHVDTWMERIILSDEDNPFLGAEFDIKRLDEIPSIAPVDVPVEFKGTL